MADYKTYLASSILTEDKVVTYRLLSRALKIHVNAAKEMLYEFYRQQNGRKPCTLYATYLVSGVRRKEEEPEDTNSGLRNNGESHYMQSSPYMSSPVPESNRKVEDNAVVTISLVREEDLEDVRSKYEQISSIHIYSVGPSPLKDLQVLSDVARELHDLCKEEDPLESGPRYGTIVNKNAKRRTGRKPPATTSAATITIAAVDRRPADTKEAAKSSTSTLNSEAKVAERSTASEFFGKGKPKSKKATVNSISKEPALPAKKRDSPSVFKSFAKTTPKIKKDDTESSAGDSSAFSGAVNSPMKDSSDDEEETWALSPQAAATEIVDSDCQFRKEREAALRNMMEEEDVPTPTAQYLDEANLNEPSVEVKEEAPVVSDGRRRGRRRVMKKNTVQDEEGYLVTKEEAVWESFSEEEPAPKPRPKVRPSTTIAKPNKGAEAKAGQGSIMSFFGKK